MAKKFVYTPRTAATVEQRSQGGGDFDTYLKRGVKTFKPKEGKHKIRILPATWDDKSHYGLDTWLNYNIGPDKGSYLSLHKMKGQKDPVYEEYAKAKAEGREDDAKNLAARKRILVYVIDRKQEDAGPLLWPMPITVDKALCMLSVDSDTQEVLAIDSPDDGYDVTFTKTGEGQFTKYEAVSIARNPSALSDDDDTYNAWLDFIVENPAPDQLNYYSYDHIKRAFTGEVQPTAEVAPKEETRRVTKAASVVKEAEPAVEEDDDEAEAVEEVKAPARTGLAARLANRSR